MLQPVVETLSNGLTVAIIPAPASHQVQVALFVRAGSRFEPPESQGISHFLEHMLFRGCGSHPTSESLSLVFESVGTQPNAVTGVETTEFDFIAHPNRLPEALMALSGLVRDPVYSELEKERGIIHDEIQYDYNEQGELINLGSLTAALLWPGHPLGQSVIGTAQTLAEHTETSLRAYHQWLYRPENTVLGLVGQVNPAIALKATEQAFGDWVPSERDIRLERMEAIPQGDAPRIHTVRDPDNQFHLQLSFPAPGYNAPEEAAMVMMTRMLDDGPTSRLQQAVREQGGLAYHVAADYAGFHDVGQYDFVTSLGAGRLVEGLAAMMDVLVRLREDGPTAQELERAKRRHRFELEFAQDDLRNSMDRYVWPLLYSTPRSEAEEMETMEAVTAQQIQAQAAAVLRRDNACLALVGPVEEATQAIVRQALDKL